VISIRYTEFFSCRTPNSISRKDEIAYLSDVALPLTLYANTSHHHETLFKHMRPTQKMLYNRMYIRSFLDINVFLCGLTYVTSSVFELIQISDN